MAGIGFNFSFAERCKQHNGMYAQTIV